MISQLYIWTVVAVTGGSSQISDWRYMGEYNNIEPRPSQTEKYIPDNACHTAARTLGIPKSRYRCIDKASGNP